MVASVQSLAQSAVARVAASAETLVLQPGQVLEALVLGKTPDGLTALKIGDLVINAQFPQTLPPGTALQLQVKVAGGTPQLAIVTPAVAPAAAPQPLPLPAALSLGVTVQLTNVVPEPVVAAAQQVVPAAVAAEPVRAAAPNGVPTPPLEVAIATAGRTTVPQTATIAARAERQAAAASQPTTASAAATMPSVQPLPTSANGESRQSVMQAGARIAGSVPAAAAAASAPVIATPNPVLPVTSQGPAASAAPSAQPPAPVSPGPQLSSTAPVAMFALPSTAAPTKVAQATASPTSPQPAVTSVPVTTAAASPIAPPSVAPVPPTLISAASVPAHEPEGANPLLAAQGAPRPPATMADLPRSLPQAQPQPAMQATPPQPATPQAALAQMVPEAMAKQNSLAPLLTSLVSAIAKPSALPEPVVRAALQMLAQRIAMPAGGPTADLLKAAIAKSGVYLEAGLAKAAPPSADLKAGLVAVKGALATSLGGNPAPVSMAHQAAPPLRGMPPRAEQIDLPPLPDAPREIARVLHGQADAALSRVKLMQLASLPDAGPQRGPGPELRTELPFLIGSELVMAQFQIFRDGRRSKAQGTTRGWTMRFAMNFSGTGEVGAEIGLLGRSVNVALWAVEPDIAERLSATLPDLNRALAALGLQAGAVRVRNAPPDPPKPASGHFVDSLS